MNNAPDWDIALDRLEFYEKAYSDLGLPGILGLAVIHKMQAQYYAGDRSAELYQRIMEIQ